MSTRWQRTRGLGVKHRGQDFSTVRRMNHVELIFRVWRCKGSSPPTPFHLHHFHPQAFSYSDWLLSIAVSASDWHLLISSLLCTGSLRTVKCLRLWAGVQVNDSTCWDKKSSCRPHLNNHGSTERNRGNYGTENDTFSDWALLQHCHCHDRWVRGSSCLIISNPYCMWYKDNSMIWDLSHTSKAVATDKRT